MAIWQAGGIISYPMALLAMLLFYACGRRYHLLGQDWQGFAQRRSRHFPQVNYESYLSELFLKISLQLVQYQTIIKGTVTCAPLLGLLGTVIGMIETFESLEDQALFSSQGGIAAGIAQALVTTEMGLIIALVGLFLGRFFQSQQKKIMSSLILTPGGGDALTH